MIGFLVHWNLLVIYVIHLVIHVLEIFYKVTWLKIDIVLNALGGQFYI